MQMIEQLALRDDATVVMNLKRANARRQFQYAFDVLRLQPLHECVHAKAQLEVEYEIAVFDQKIFVTGLAIAHRRSGISLQARWKNCATINAFAFGSPNVGSRAELRNR